MTRALLFLNGEAPCQLPSRSNNYHLAVCTDGAYSHYLLRYPFKIDYIIGDFDSLELSKDAPHPPLILTPDQSKNDFEKALLFLLSKRITNVDIYGIGGRASDHFLGNLSVALHYHTQLNLTFFDNYSRFFFAPPRLVLNDVNNRIISVLPFPKADAVTLVGFAYPLNGATLEWGQLISLRNRAIQNTVTISHRAGNILVFITG